MIKVKIEIRNDLGYLVGKTFTSNLNDIYKIISVDSIRRTVVLWNTTKDIPGNTRFSLKQLGEGIESGTYTMIEDDKD